MIYAIEAVGTEYVKFGIAQNLKRRLVFLQVGCPLELRNIASANWPDSEEDAIHFFLADKRLRGEWFSKSDETRLVVQYMQDAAGGGLVAWRDLMSRALVEMKESTAPAISLARTRVGRFSSSIARARTAEPMPQPQHYYGEAPQQSPIIPALAVDRS